MGYYDYNKLVYEKFCLNKVNAFFPFTIRYNYSAIHYKILFTKKLLLQINK